MNDALVSIGFLLFGLTGAIMGYFIGKDAKGVNGGKK